MAPTPASSRTGLALVSLTVLLAASLRFPDLDLKPLHSDEGVNGWFSLRLEWWGLYRYRPSDYHGPFLYYVNQLLFRLLGPSEFSLRLGTALAGTLLPLCLLPLRRYLKPTGMFCAALLLATSPTMVYFARTNIHETWLIVASTLWAAGLIRYCQSGRRCWALLSSASAALAFANKETALITLGSLGCGLTWAWLMGSEESAGPHLDDPELFSGANRRQALNSLMQMPWRDLLAGMLLFSAIIALLFSSMGSWLPGIGAFFEAFLRWTEHGLSGRNQSKEWSYFLNLLMESNGLIPLLGAGTASIWALRARHRSGLFFSGWALSALLAYSLIPYKTPWCVLSIELPLLLCCGWLVGQLVGSYRDSLAPPLERVGAALAVLILLAAALPMAQQSLNVNKNGYDDPTHQYVFVQTERGYYEFLQDLFGLGDIIQQAHQRRPELVNVDPKNPTRWYTITRGWEYRRRDYLNGKLPSQEQLERAEIITCTGRNLRSIRKALQPQAGQWQENVYQLRPGVRLWAWYRQELWQEYQDQGGRSASPWPRPVTSKLAIPPLPKRYQR